MEVTITEALEIERELRKERDRLYDLLRDKDVKKTFKEKRELRRKISEFENKIAEINTEIRYFSNNVNVPETGEPVILAKYMLREKEKEMRKRKEIMEREEKKRFEEIIMGGIDENAYYGKLPCRVEYEEISSEVEEARERINQVFDAHTIKIRG